MKKILYFLSVVFIFLFNNLYSQDAAYTMTATTKTITSCRSTLDADLACVAAGKVVYCNNTDRAYTFVSGSGTVLNANLTLHVLDDDFIYVYDGPTSASPLIATWTGNTNPTTGLNATSTGSVITIRFVSNNTNASTINAGFGSYFSGWSILIGCPPSNCNGNTPANDNCSAAPQICNLTGYCGNTSGWYNEDNGALEGQAAPGFGGSIENNSWINFVASATTSTLVVSSANCLLSGSGIQGVVYASTNCSTFTPVSGGNFNQNTAAGTVTLNLTGLTAGQDYYLMLDGFGGNVCDYTVTATGNVQTLATTSSASTNTICPNQQFTVTATAGATSYSWNPAPISTSSNTAVFNNISSTSVISTTAFGYCGASATVALTMSVVSLPVSASSTTICSGNSATLTATGATSYTWSTGATTSTVSVSPASPTVYSFTGTANGCTNTNTVSVSVTANPTVAVTNTTICNGTPVTLTASGATTYSWNTGATTSSISVTPTTTTIYTVTGTSSGCANTNTVSVSVTANPTVAVTNTTICNGTPITLTASGATTYSWNTGATTSTISVTPTTTTIYTVTGTTSGCTNTKTVSVTVNSIPTTTASTSGSLTCSSLNVTLNSSLAGVSYTWSAPSGGAISSANTQSTSASGAAGTYTLLVQNAAGCTFTTTTTVTQNTTAPSGVSAGSNQTLGCGSATVVTLSGSATTPTNATASWSGPSISGSTTSFTTTVNGSGTYTLTTTNPINGCTASSTVLVNPSAGAPSLTVNAITNTITCTNTLVTVSISSTVSPASYTWSGTGINSGNGTGTITVNQGGTFNYTLTNTTNSCSASGSTVVVSNTAVPTTTASTTGNLTCASTTVALNSTLAGMNYTWTAPSGGSVGSANTQSTTASGTAGTYTVKVVNPSNGCIYTTTTAVTQNTTVPTTTASTTGTLTCTTSTVSLSSTLAGMNYTWTAPSGGSVSSANAQNTSASGTPGNYTIMVSNAANGCTYTTTTAVTQNTTAPSGVSAGSNQTLGCGSATVVTLNGSATTPTNATASWSGPSISGSTTSFTTTVNGAGTYTLTATNPVNGCVSTSTVLINPSAGSPALTVNPVTNTITCTNTLVTVSISSTVAPASYTWSGTGITGGNGTGTITVNQAGTFNYTLTNTTNSCTSSGSQIVTNNTVTPTTTINTIGNLTCATTTVELNSATSGLNYTWTAPSGGTVGSANTQTTSITGTGDYTLTVVDPSNGCSNNFTTTVTSNTAVPTTTASVTGVLTCVTTTVDLNSTLTGMNYTWTAPSGGSVGSANTQSTTATGAGDYSLTVVDPSNGCSYTTAVTATQNTVAPTGVSAGSNQTLTCSSTSITLSGSVTSPTNALLDWGTSVCGTQTTAVTTACAAGVYTLTATDPSNGCTATSTVEIFPNAGAPSATISATALTIDCNNASQSVTVTSTPSTNVIYNWNNTPFSASADSSIATFNSGGTYICTVTNTISGCSTPIQVVVSNNTSVPTISITGTQTLTCSSPSVAISLTTTPTSGLTYSWSGASIVSGQGTDAIAVNQSGVYTVTVTDGANGCVNTATTQVDADSNVPSASVTASSTNSVITCQNTSVTLTVSVNPSATYSYTWSPSGGNASSANVTSAGSYSVLVLNATTGCSTTAFYTVTSNTTAPSITSADAVIPCGSPSVALGASSSATNASFGWTTSGTGTILSGSNTASPTAGASGPYVVTVTDNDNGCTNSQTVNVTQTSITAGFVANPTSGTAPLTVGFTNQSTTPATYSWNFGDPTSTDNTSSLTDPSHVFNTLGTYTVLLTVSNGSCVATASVTIDVFENSSIIVPNVFTPNGDKSNDTFKFKTVGIKDLTCDIFNRWGQKLYTIKDVNDSWDGGDAPDGTYFFMLQATGYDGKEYKQQNFLSLFR